MIPTNLVKSVQLTPEQMGRARVDARLGAVTAQRKRAPGREPRGNADSARVRFAVVIDKEVKGPSETHRSSSSFRAGRRPPPPPAAAPSIMIIICRIWSCITA